MDDFESILKLKTTKDIGDAIEEALLSNVDFFNIPYEIHLQYLKTLVAQDTYFGLLHKLIESIEAEQKNRSAK